MMAQEHTYSLAVKKIAIPNRAKYIRVIFCEITRNLNHLLAVGCQALVVGTMFRLAQIAINYVFKNSCKFLKVLKIYFLKCTWINRY